MPAPNKSAHHVLSRQARRAFALLTACGLLLGAAQNTPADQRSVGTASAPRKTQTMQQVTLVCDVAYLPSRSTWVRTVQLTHDERALRSVLIDGVPVYTFAVRDTWVLTAQDNERIQLDTKAMAWSSDFRGLASGQGRCERQL